MGLFKEIKCTKCNNICKMLTRTKLKDGNYLCWNCTKRIPEYMMDSIRNSYSLDDYEQLLSYIEYSDSTLNAIFTETQCYCDIHLDSEHGLLFIGNPYSDTKIIWELHRIESFELVFSPEKYKEGMLSDAVTGKILFQIKVRYPYFYHEKIVKNGVKAKAKTTFFKTKVEYENPKGMDEFLLYFRMAYERSILVEETKRTEQAEFGKPVENNELQQAMAVFMLDGLASVTIQDLQNQRKRLLKVFHPDNGGEEDNKYAQKINNAYEVIKKYLENF